MPTSAADILLLRREVELSRRLAQLHADNAIAYHIPHEKQYQFYTADKRFRHCCWGNQSGKSDAGSIEDGSFSLGYRPFMERRFPIINGRNEVVAWHEGYKGHPFATLGIPSHPTKGLIICEDWDKSKEIFTENEGSQKGKLMAYLPKDSILSTTKNHSGAIDRILVKHKSGGISTIQIDTVQSYKQSQMSMESSIWDWIHVDEPCPEGMFKAAARGLMARNGRAWLNLTPLTEPWIQDMFMPGALQLSDAVSTYNHNDRIMITASMDDNPYLSAEGREAFKALLTPDELECRVRGIPSTYSGIIYKEFKQNEHIYNFSENPLAGWKNESTPPDDYTLRFAIDYHQKKNHHVLFLATSPNDITYAYAELWVDSLMSKLFKEIKSVFDKREATVPGLIDPLAATPNRVTEISALDEIIRLGLPVIPATKDPHNGILKVREVLASRDRKGFPTFYVNSNLNRFLFEICRGFIWDEKTNKPRKLNDDAMENLYRLCLQGLDYIEPSTDDDYSVYLPKDLSNNNLDVREFEERAPTKVSKFNLATRHRQRG